MNFNFNKILILTLLLSGSISISIKSEEPQIIGPEEEVIEAEGWWGTYPETMPEEKEGQIDLEEESYDGEEAPIY